MSAGTQATKTNSSFGVKDTAEKVFAGLSNVLAVSKLVSITLTDSPAPVWSLTAIAYAADLAILNKITSACSLTVAGATVAQAAGLQADVACSPNPSPVIGFESGYFQPPGWRRGHGTEGTIDRRDHRGPA